MATKYDRTEEDSWKKKEFQLFWAFIDWWTKGYPFIKKNLIVRTNKELSKKGKKWRMQWHFQM